MTVLAVLALPAQAESAALVSMAIGRGTGGALRMKQAPGFPQPCSHPLRKAAFDPWSPEPALFLCIGLSNGVMLRARLDLRTGQLADSRTRFLGAVLLR